MFKRVFLVLMAIVMISSSAFAAEAPDRVNKADWGIEGGGSFPGDNIESAGYIQTNLSYGLTPWVAIGVEGGWWEGDVDSGNNDEAIGVFQILADVIVRVPTLHDQIVPYGLFGLGFANTYVDDAPTDPAGADDNDGSFAWKIGGGFDWIINPNWAFNFEVAQNENSPDLPQATTEDTDFLSVIAGLKYIF